MIKKISKLTVGFTLFLALMALSTIQAYAETNAKDALVNYWYQVRLVEGDVDSITPQTNDPKKVIQNLDTLIVQCQKAKDKLQAIKIDPSIALDVASTQEGRVQTLDYTIEALKDIKDFYLTQNPLKMIEALNLLQSITQVASKSEEDLIYLCRKALPSTENLPNREALIVYWAASTEKEITLSNILDNLIKTTLELVQSPESNAKPGELEGKMAAMLGNFEKELSAVGESLKQVPIQPSLEGELRPLHNAKIKVIEKTVAMLHTLNSSLAKKDINQLAVIQKQAQEITAQTKDFQKQFVKLVKKYK